MRTIIEPFRTKTVEPIRFTTRAERERFLRQAGWNLFQIKAEHVVIDLLTDSGTSAMSSHQWAAMMTGDESYAGGSSFFRFRDAIQDIFGFPQVIPVHQGRAAERILFGQIVKEGDFVPSNTHFDTTRANIEARGAQAIDLPSATCEAFQGNIDLDGVRNLIDRVGAGRVPLGMITVTNNAAGGQPAALENIQAYGRLLHEYGIPLFIDAARFAENAYLIKLRSARYRPCSVRSIVREIFSAADGCLMSAKKDGLANMGGFIALGEPELAARLKQNLIVTEGFPTYGGLSGRDLDAIASGLHEVLSEDYLAYRLASASYLARGLQSAGAPIVTPPGMHAIYIDAQKFFPHLSPLELPGQALACELYLEAGIRTCEIGTVMFGRTDATGTEIPATNELVRLALPRRVYSQSHYDYVIEAAELVFKRRETVAGLRITSPREPLRHFTARFEPISSNWVLGSNGTETCHKGHDKWLERR